MENHAAEHAMAELTQADALQTEVAHQRLALEWGQALFVGLVHLWKQLETHETLAYEDKVTMQISLLEDASSHLHRLRKELTATGRRLKEHRQCLRRPRVLRGI